jgi:hypothetical protein
MWRQIGNGLVAADSSFGTASQIGRAMAETSHLQSSPHPEANVCSGVKSGAIAVSTRLFHFRNAPKADAQSEHWHLSRWAAIRSACITRSRAGASLKARTIMGIIAPRRDESGTPLPCTTIAADRQRRGHHTVE